MALDQDRSATADVEARVDSGEHGGLDSKLLASASLPEREELAARALQIDTRYGLPARKWLRMIRPLPDSVLARP